MYDAFADEFAAHAEHSAYNAHYDRPAVLEALGDVSGSTVLDVGCGSGLYAVELVRRGAKVIGIDGSARLIEHARQRLDGSADLRVHDLSEPLDWLADQVIDEALMALVIHHLEDPLPTLREIHRVLRPGGRLLVSTVHPFADWRHAGGSYFTDEMIDETWNSGWKVRFRRAPLAAWSASFLEAGFLVERLIEPLPAESMKADHPDLHDRFTAEPFFIIFQLVKVAAPAAPGPGA